MKRAKQPSYKKEQRHFTNKQCLRFDKVRLIDLDKTNHGVIPVGRALRVAEDQDHDLICINPNVNPPVCKVGDYSKMVFDLQKAKRMQKKLQTKNVMKEMDFRPAIQDHDFDTKCRKIKDFINKGNKVKVVIKIRGREFQLFDYKSFFDRVLEKLENVKFDSDISKTHGRYSRILTIE